MDTLKMETKNTRLVDLVEEKRLSYFKVKNDKEILSYLNKMINKR